jgi:hypothetical protein
VVSATTSPRFKGYDRKKRIDVHNLVPICAPTDQNNTTLP